MQQQWCGASCVLGSPPADGRLSPATPPADSPQSRSTPQFAETSAHTLHTLLMGDVASRPACANLRHFLGLRELQLSGNSAFVGERAELLCTAHARMQRLLGCLVVRPV